MLIIGLIAATLRAHQARTDANIAAERAAARILVAGSMPLTPEREQHARVAAAGGYLDATDSLPDYPGEKEWAEALSQLEELATGILQQLAQAAEAGAQDFTRKTERAQRDAPEADLRVTGNPETPASEGNPEEPSAKGAARRSGRKLGPG
ncbi:MAG TPA: hypothetical protein PK625_00170 [Spirochaetales bacterium]|nr:hypothetical protein [Spirochaetales bacterium]